MKKRIAAVILAGALAISSLAGCGTGNAAKTGGEVKASDNLPLDESGQPSPFGKYKEPVTVEIVQSINPTLPIPEGESATDNYYTRYVKEHLNIDTKVKWSASSADYSQKLNLAIASNDIPDILVVNAQELRKLVKSDMLADLTPYFDTYTSDIIKDNINATDGKAMESVTFDGKIYALPNVQAEADGYNNMWIRMDWLEELGLQVPTTMEELETVAKAFVDNNMGGENTIGILGPTINMRLYNDFISSTNNMNNLDGIFQAYKSWPGFWIEDKDGNPVYGSITGETKEALAELQKLYKEGLLDQELGVRKDADEAWKSGKAGILFSPWWNGYNIQDSLENNPEADWQAFAAPLASDGQWYPKQGGVGGSYCVARKGYEHPEVVFTLNSLLRRDEGVFAAETKLDAGFYPGRVVIAAYDECSFTVEALIAKIDGKEVPEYDPINYKLLNNDFITLEQCLKPPYEDLSIGNWSTDAPDFGRLYSLFKGYECVVDAQHDGIVNKTYSLIYSQTETMEKKWANLKKKEDETFLKIIIGEASIDTFDTFVTEWKAEGGDEITKEVAEAVK